MDLEEIKNFHKIVIDNLYDGVYVVDKERQLIYWNQAAENITGYDAQTVIGSYCYDNILEHVDDTGTNLCTNKCPLVKTMNDGKIREEHVFLHHKQGYRVPVLIKVVPLKNDEGEIIGAIETFIDNNKKISLLERIKKLEEENQLDALTQIGNRKHIENNIHDKFNELKRYERRFGILFIDLDDFKEINDSYGHEIGDRILINVAATMEKNLRSFDTIGRWGGDEFIAVISEVSTKNLEIIANKLKKLIANSYILYNNEKVNITASIGGAIASPNDTKETLLKRADASMYFSKSKGKNKVHILE